MIFHSNKTLFRLSAIMFKLSVTTCRIEFCNSCSSGCVKINEYEGEWFKRYAIVPSSQKMPLNLFKSN